MRAELEAAAAARGWTVTRVRDTATFCRLVVHGEDDLLVDIALDSSPSHPRAPASRGRPSPRKSWPPASSSRCSTRGAARDFADVFVLTKTFGADGMFAGAQALDAGMTRVNLAESIESLRRFTDAEVPVDAEDVPALNAFFAAWSEQLRAAGAE